jgi:mannose-6-phosphate isomerase-like protein (cupin superfamily)
MPAVISRAGKPDPFPEHSSLENTSRSNGHDVMATKVEGAFVRHLHMDTNGVFPVLGSHLIIRQRNGHVPLGSGDLDVNPKGVDHQSTTKRKVRLLLIEPFEMPNAGGEVTAAPELPSAGCSLADACAAHLIREIAGRARGRAQATFRTGRS